SAPANLAEAARIVAQRDAGFLLLLNENGGARGVLTRADLLAAEGERLRRLMQAMERVAEELRAENEDAGREHLRVMGMLAHDLRGPLGGIRSIAQLLATDPDVAPEQVRHFARLIGSQSEGMLKLVRNILDLARTSTGRVHLKLEPVNPVELVYETSALYEQMAARKGIRFDLRLPGQPCPLVHVDRDKMLNAVGNLLDNGVKYCSAGQQVRVWLEASPTAVTIAVADNGQA
ncbi:MAG: HAMP domain-containing histidine kinase, partial [Planctomycetota bacterium]|nr:HAMP domain-containing histidine kinase [Planctomycetota bacterium]